LFYQNLLISSFVNIQTKRETKITKKDVSDYYLKNKNSFKRIDEEVLVKHFVFSDKKTAEKIKKELNKKASKTNFEKLLRGAIVETKTLKRGGAGSNLVGFVFSGELGAVLGPKKHDKKYHLFHILQKHAKGSFLGLEKVYDEIYQRIYKIREVDVFREILDSLYQNSDVFVSQEIFE